MATKTLREAFKDIADAIREKGITGTMTPLEMPEKVSEISGGGGMKYGVPIDGLLGDVDQNGQLGNPTEPFSFTSNDIRTVLQNALAYKFQNNSGITSLSLPNLTQVNQNGMQHICDGCSNLTSVYLPNLTTVEGWGAEYAFNGCTSLTSVDLSSLSTVGTDGMAYSFRGCTSLTSVDLSSLSSVTSSSGMYYAFYGCTSLTSVDLSSLSSINGATGMAYSFQGCTSLTSVDLSSLSNTNGTSTIYSTFRDCTALQEVKFNNATAIPAIDTTTFQNTNSTFKIIVPNDLYKGWRTATNWSTYANQIEKAYPGVEFKALEANSTIRLVAVGEPDELSFEYFKTGDSDWTEYTIGDTITLQNVDDVLYIRNTSTTWTNLGKSENDYYQFQMTGLIEANEELAYLNRKSGIGSFFNSAYAYCYYKLFSGCTALTKAPKFYSNQTNANAHYAFAYMFEGCTNLEEQPELFNVQGGTYGSIRSNYLYKGMFKGCTSLENVELNFKTLSDNSTYTSTGAFEEMFDGCTNLNEIKLLQYRGTFDTTHFDNWVRDVAASGTFIWNGTDTTTGDYAIPSGWTIQDIPYSGLTFTAREANSTVAIVNESSAPTLRLQYSIDNGGTWNTFTVGTTTVTLANVGDKVSFRGTNTKWGGGSNNSRNRFTFTGKVAVSGNINSVLDQTNYETLLDLSSGRDRLFQFMFYGNTGLVDAEGLVMPATRVGGFYCNDMFGNCTNLVNPPKELPATYIANTNWAYSGMFKGCTSLVKSPYIRITNVPNQTFAEMFNGCSSLQEIKLDYTGSFGTGAFNNWVNGVSGTGKFYYNGTSTTRGASNIPTNWTITPFIPDDQKDRSCIRCFKADMNTGVIPTTTTKVVATLRGTTEGNWFIGNSGQRYRFFNSQNTTYLDVNGQGNRISTANSWDTTKWYDVEFGNFYFKTTDPDGVVVTNTSTARTFTQTNPLYLNSYNYQWSGNYSLFDCAGFKIYDGDTLLKEYEPAVDGNGVYCFLEKVSNTYAYPTNGAFGGYIQPTT